ncbi:MAG: Holliday junction branch migration protein RuvA [Acidobacteriota bacterium]
MIGRLRGRLLEREPSGLVVEAGGVGYQVQVPLTTFTRLQDETVDLFIHTEVRTDAILLFGFLTRPERETFRKLMAVQGVGPMTALAVLSGLTFDELLAAIRGGDTRRLQSIPRVGKKTAERICLELREKMADFGGTSPPGTSLSAGGGDLTDALTALESLGYKALQAEKALTEARAQAPDGPIETWIRLALKSLS